ncbi:MAG TPA: hypothetical protein VGC41_16470, partial [Kofleriaceae bacterium]
MRSRILVPLALLGACAQAGKADNVVGRPDGSAPTTDSTPPPDAFVDPIDAPPNVMTKTLEEATNTTLTVGASIACLNQNNGYTHLSSYYRVFDPSSFQVTSDFHVTQVGFQVEDSESGAGNGVQVAVSVGTYNTTPTTQSIDPAQMSQLATVGAVQVPQIADIGGNVNVPITATIPAGKRLYIQIDTPEGDNATHT